MATASTSPPPDPAYLAENCSNRLVAAIAVMLTLSTLFLVLRLYARTLTKASRGWDEYLLPIAWLFMVGLCANDILMVTSSGAGRHVEYIAMTNPGALTLRMKLVMAQSYLTTVSNTLSRASIAALYLRLFPNKRLRQASYLILFYLVALAVSQMIAGLFECRPFSVFWNAAAKNAKCFNLFLYFELAGVLNIVGDLALMLIPVPIIWNLQTSTSRKCGIAVVFLSGCLGLIASCIRTGMFFSRQKIFHEDPTWSDATLVSWTLVESGMYLSAACIIGLRPVAASTSRWVKDSMSSIESRLLSSRRRTEISSKSSNKGSQESFSGILPGVNGGEHKMQSFSRGVRHDRDTSFGSKDIRVHSDFNIMTTNVD